MSLDQLQQEIDRSFGDGPAHPPVEARIAAGRRAVVRRRAASAMAACAVLAVAGTAYWATTPGEPVGDGSLYIATDPPAPTASEVAWEDDTPIRYLDGELQIRRGVVVHERIDNPYDYEPPRQSVALDLTWQGQRQWVIAESKPSGFGYSASVPSNGWASFEAYVADQVDGQTGGESGWPTTMRLTDDGRVVPVDGVTVYNRTDDPQLGDSFAEPGATTGAAVVAVAGEPRSYFIVWRVVQGELDVITTPPNDVTGATFQELLSYARSQYSSGEGLR